MVNLPLESPILYSHSHFDDDLSSAAMHSQQPFEITNCGLISTCLTQNPIQDIASKLQRTGTIKNQLISTN